MSDGVSNPGGVDAAVLEQGLLLVSAAFDEARASGREHWDRMTTAVLKNRLLNSTVRAFRETDYGVSSMVDFARLFPRELDVDTTTRPPTVRFLQPETLTATADEPTARSNRPNVQRIRPDLWRAVVDQRSGSQYVWDEVAGIARVADDGDPNPVLPTLTSAELAQWRQEFTDAARPSIQSESTALKRLDEWFEHSYGTAFLPVKLRGEWNGFFRGKVVNKIREFFADNSLSLPANLVIISPRKNEATSSRQTDRPSNLGQLRELVQRCVAVMTEQELADLKVSPAIMLRATRGKA